MNSFGIYLIVITNSSEYSSSVLKISHLGNLEKSLVLQGHSKKRTMSQNSKGIMIFSLNQQNSAQTKSVIIDQNLNVRNVREYDYEVNSTSISDK